MKSKRLRILALASWYPSPQDPRLGNFVKRHLKVLAMQHEVTVISAVEATEAEIQVQEHKGLREIQVHFQKKLPLHSYLQALKKGLQRALEVGGPFDLCHLHVGYPAGLLALQLDLPYLITEHYSGYQHQNRGNWKLMQRKLAQRIIRKAHHLCPVSAHLGRAMQQFAKTSTPFTAVSNVVDTAIFKPAKRTASGVFRFLHISTLEERSKNINGILAGFKALQDRGADFILQIGGDGDLDELKRKIAASGLQNHRVEIIPPQDSQGIARLMQQADVYVMFSHFENQPCTILEALCCGTPVVSSKVGGIAEVIRLDNGLLVPPENIPAFTAALAQVMEHRNDYDSPAIARLAAANYGPEAILEQYNRVYASVLS